MRSPSLAGDDRAASPSRPPPRRPTLSSPEQPALPPVARVAVDTGLAHLDRPFDYAVPALAAPARLPGPGALRRPAGRRAGAGAGRRHRPPRRPDAAVGAGQPRAGAGPRGRGAVPGGRRPVRRDAVGRAAARPAAPARPGRRPSRGRSARSRCRPRRRPAPGSATRPGRRCCRRSRRAGAAGGLVGAARPAVAGRDRHRGPGLRRGRPGRAGRRPGRPGPGPADRGAGRPRRRGAARRPGTGPALPGVPARPARARSGWCSAPGRRRSPR